MTRHPVVLQVIPSLSAGGAEQATVDIHAALIQRHGRAFVASSGGTRMREIEAAGGVHITLPLASKNPLTMLRNAFRLAAVVRREGITIIHARSRAPAWSALWAARMTGAVFMTTFHAAYKFTSAPKKFYNSVMARGDRIIAISAMIADHIRENYRVPAARIVTIPRGIDMTRFCRAAITPERLRNLRTTWGIAEGQKIILLPARVSRIKGHSVLIEAMGRLAAAGESHLPVAVMIGDDQGRSDYRRDMQDLIARHGLDAHVRLLDHCADMPAAYALSDLVVMPSIVPEGFGRVPVEAQAMGVPVIASDLGATRETVQHGQTGWLFPAGDAAALADRLHAALAQSATERDAMASAARSHALERFDKESMVARTLEVYEDISHRIP